MVKNLEELWNSMFAFARPEKFGYASLTPRVFLESYIERQTKAKRLAYVECVKANPKEALEIAGAVIARRSGKQAASRTTVTGTSQNVRHATVLGQLKDESDLNEPQGVFTIFVDAGTRNNGHKGKQQTWIAGSRMNSSLVFEEYIGDKTNNEGEIAAIIKALELTKRKKMPANVYSDSAVAVGWAQKGKTGKAAAHCAESAARANQLLSETMSSLTLVSRDINRAGWHLEKKYSV